MSQVIEDVRHATTTCAAWSSPARAAAVCAGDDFQAIFLAEDRPRRKIDRQINRIKAGETALDVIFGLEKPTDRRRQRRRPSATAWTSPCTATSGSPRPAKLGWFFVRRGVMGTIGGTFILRQLVGLSKAMELTLTGDLVDADEALRIGLVSSVVLDDELMDEAHALARKIASGPPLAQQAIKRAVHKSFEIPGSRSASTSRPSATCSGRPTTTWRASARSWRSARPSSRAARDRRAGGVGRRQTGQVERLVARPSGCSRLWTRATSVTSKAAPTGSPRIVSPADGAASRASVRWPTKRCRGGGRGRTSPPHGLWAKTSMPWRARRGARSARTSTARTSRAGTRARPRRAPGPLSPDRPRRGSAT